MLRFPFIFGKEGKKLSNKFHMKRANQDIRDQIKSSPVFSYEVAAELGYTDNYFNALLRHPLEGKRREQVEQAIKAAISKKQESMEKVAQ